MVNDYFIGKEVSTLNADKFTIEHIDRDMIETDRELMEKKFWDYKMWHPFVATMYFVHRYYAIAAALAEKELGTTEAKRLRAINSRYDLRKQPLATIRAFWKARQAADGIGCNYDVYIRAAIRQFRANIKLMASYKASGNKQRFPYPAQLVSTFIIDEAIKDWTKEKNVRFPMPQHEGIPNNTQLWFRPEMEAWLIEEASKVRFGQSYVEEARDKGIILGPA